MNAVEVVGLRKTYGREGAAIAVDDVSFTIDERGALALIGESGSGKTTIARMLLGLERPTAGRILLEGSEVEPWRRAGRERRARARQVQIVFQDPYLSLNPRVTIREAIAAVLRLHGSSRAEAESRTIGLLDDVGLGAREGAALPGALSGGQRQRACIARALAVDPRLLILDEAVSALDVSVQAQILNLLNDLRAERTIAYLFITHNLAVVPYVTDTAVVLHRGRIVEQGRTREVLDEPHDDYTRQLIAAVPGERREDPE
ncbi:ATP-binding cassette domain-containing protein [Microbacterium sp. CCNWLW134]|uniref:ABC transporter ATP-binding protein n=1 Tax=Microbacterium sp. CCNWLW134 TaxID=3122064 RepID=UPI0030103279